MTFYSPYLSAALVNFRGEGQLIEFGFLFWLFLFYFFIPFVLDIEGITIELIKSWLLVVFVILCSLAILLVLDKTITRWVILFIFLIFKFFMKKWNRFRAIIFQFWLRLIGFWGECAFLQLFITLLLFDFCYFILFLFLLDYCSLVQGILLLMC